MTAAEKHQRMGRNSDAGGRSKPLFRPVPGVDPGLPPAQGLYDPRQRA